jgi:GT2 family glycosyltransferase
MSHAKGEIIVFTDSDCILSHTFLENHLRIHKENNGIDGFSGSISANTHLKYGFIAFVDHLNNWFNYHSGLPERDVEYLPGANMSIKRRVIQSGIKWSEKQIAGEDVDFSLKLLSQGMRMKFHPDAKVRHIDRATLKQFLLHQYNWGFHAPFVRGANKRAAYSFLFPNNIIKTILLLPIIIFGYTALVIRSWLCICPFWLLIISFPLILIGKIWYARGVLAGTYALVKNERQISA